MLGLEKTIVNEATSLYVKYKNQLNLNLFPTNKIKTYLAVKMNGKTLAMTIELYLTGLTLLLSSIFSLFLLKTNTIIGDIH